MTKKVKYSDYPPGTFFAFRTQSRVFCSNSPSTLWGQHIPDTVEVLGFIPKKLFL